MKKSKIIYAGIFSILCTFGVSQNCNARAGGSIGPIVPEPTDPYSGTNCGSCVTIANIYCSSSQIASGVCGSVATAYTVDEETGTFVVGNQHFATAADMVNNNPLTEEQLAALSTQNIVEEEEIVEDTPTTPKAKRTYYTPTEAAAHVNHTNKNKIIFTFK